MKKLKYGIAVAVLAGVLAVGSTGSMAQTLTIGVRAGPESIDTHFTATGTHAEALKHVFDTLTWSGPGLEIQPRLAESWKAVSADTWEFKLRDDVYFHDGSKMTADDVAFSLERADKLNSRIHTLLRMESIEVIDPLTIRIKTSDPNPTLPAALHFAAPLAIISPKSVNDKGEVVAPIGTGPFKFDGYDESTHVLTVAKNANWWGGDVKLDGIVIKPITDPNTRALSLENGEVDFTVDVPYNEIEGLNGKDGITVDKFENSRLIYLLFNQKKAPFDDVRVRKAIAYGMDRQEIVQYVLFGVGSPAVGIYRPDFYDFLTQPFTENERGRFGLGPSLGTP